MPKDNGRASGNENFGDAVDQLAVGGRTFSASEPADAADPTEANLDDALRTFGIDPDGDNVGDLSDEC